VSPAPSLPPGPRAPKVVQSIGFFARAAPYMERLRTRYGTPFTLRQLVTPPFVMLADPDAIRETFTAPPEVLHPGEGARILEPVLGRHSVILLDEDAHMSQRRLMLPAFHGAGIAALGEIIAEVSRREVERWPRDEPVALHPRLQALTLEVILRAVFGLDEGERLTALRARLRRLLDDFGGVIGFLPILQRDLGPGSPGRRFQALLAEIDDLVFGLIAERRGDPAQRDDILALLLEATHEDGSPMSDQEIRDELMTLLVAGHETTASALAWAIERLVRTPAVLDRLTAEVRGDDGEAYVTATMQETLRRRPVLPIAAPRLIKEPVTIGGWTYPPGACLCANAYLVHHDPALHPEPYAFRPERFLEQSPGTYTWIPFGGGRRRCLGASFAQLEMKAVLRALLQTADLRGDGHVELTRRRGITVSPRRGARAVLAPV